MGDGSPGGPASGPLVWSQEFDGPAGSPPDPGAWRLETGGGGWGNQELQYYTSGTENACLDGAGQLAITARQADPRSRSDRYGGRGYTSARLTSKDRVAFRYGLVQARIRLPRGRGIWPALWMLGHDIDEVGWPRCGEIDVMESLGHDPAVSYGAVHGPGYTGGAITAACHAGTNLADDFHVYSVAWEPGRISWYLDDERYAAVTPGDLRGNPWVFDHDFFLLANVAVGGTWPGSPDSSTSFPQTMLIDYIRCYPTAAIPGWQRRQ
jgi:beta-glucanase (GH16 family)